MIKPAAPWVAWGLFLSLVGAFSATFGDVPLVAAVAGGVGAVVLAVGVYRLVQHADRAAGVAAYSSEPAPISQTELDRQAAARAALAREQ